MGGSPSKAENRFSRGTSPLAGGSACRSWQSLNCPSSGSKQESLFPGRKGTVNHGASFTPPRHGAGRKPPPDNAPEARGGTVEWSVRCSELSSTTVGRDGARARARRGAAKAHLGPGGSDKSARKVRDLGLTATSGSEAFGASEDGRTLASRQVAPGPIASATASQVVRQLGSSASGFPRAPPSR